MASIIKKKIKDTSYYYYAESKRVDGKPKLVNQKYLGTAEKVLEKVLSAETPLQDKVLYSEEYEFGAVALLYDVAIRYDLINCINKHWPDRENRVNPGMSILTETIKSIVAPEPKLNLRQWYSSTCLPIITGLNPALLPVQNIRDITSTLTENTIQEIEDEILASVIKKSNITTTHILYDAANLISDTAIMQESNNERCKNTRDNQKDCRIIGLSLLLSPDYSMPFLYEDTGWSHVDLSGVPCIMNAIKSRYEQISGKKTDVTIIFNREQDFQPDIDFLKCDEIPFHFICSVDQSQVKELFYIPEERYIKSTQGNFAGVSFLRMPVIVYGHEITAIIVYNPALKERQIRNIIRNKQNTATRLRIIQDGLIKRAANENIRGEKPTIDSVTKAVEEVLSIEYMSDIFTYEVFENDGHVLLTYSESEDTCEKICDNELGKTVLYTDRGDFSNEEIITSYESIWYTENHFEQQKDDVVHVVRPYSYWADETLSSYTFTSVQKCRLCSLLRYELSNYNIYISLNNLLHEMAKIKLVLTFVGFGENQEKLESFTRTLELAEQIETLFELRRKYIKEM